MKFTQPFDHFTNNFITENWVFQSDSLDDFFDNLIQDDIFKKRKEIVKVRKNFDVPEYLKKFQKYAYFAQNQKELKHEDEKLSFLYSILDNTSFFEKLDLLKAYIIYIIHSNKEENIENFIKDTNNKVQYFNENYYNTFLEISFNNNEFTVQNNVNQISFDINDINNFKTYNFGTTKSDLILNLYKICAFYDKESIFYDVQTIFTETEQLKEINSYREMLNTLIYMFKINDYHDQLKISHLFLGFCFTEAIAVIKKFCEKKKLVYKLSDSEKTLYRIVNLSSWMGFNLETKEEICTTFVKEKVTDKEYNEKIQLFYKKIESCLKLQLETYRSLLIKTIKQKQDKLFGGMSFKQKKYVFLPSLFQKSLLNKIEIELCLWFNIYLYIFVSLLPEDKQDYHLCFEYLNNILEKKFENEGGIFYDGIILVTKIEIEKIKTSIKNHTFKEVLEKFDEIILPIAKTKTTLFGKLDRLNKLMSFLYNTSDVDTKDTDKSGIFDEPLSRILLAIYKTCKSQKIDQSKIDNIMQIASFYVRQMDLSREDLEFINYSDFECKMDVSTSSIIEEINKTFPLPHSDGRKKNKKSRRKSKKFKKVHK